MHISPYEQGNIFNRDPLRARKLLLHRNEIRKLDGLVMRQGYTLIPLELYFRAGRVKVQLGLCKGKQLHDKRDSLAKRDSDREIRRALRGIPQIEVTFSIDTNGIVHVTAKDLGTNSTQDITISGSGNMSREEIDRAIRDAQRYAAEDRQRKQTQQTRDAAESMLNQARKTRKKLKDEDRSRLDASIAELEDALKDGN